MTISPERRFVVLMVKEPRPGKVKTRLGREIGMIDAAGWYRRQCARVIRNLRDPRWQLLLAVSPDRDGLISRFWPADLGRIPQGTGDLGARMTRMFRIIPAGQVLIVGSDIPGVRPLHISNAFNALKGHDAVIGPAPDGGYWLIGLRRNRPVPHALFEGVRWSTKHAFEDTLRTLGDLRVAQTETLTDVDSAADLR